MNLFVTPADAVVIIVNFLRLFFLAQSGIQETFSLK